MNKRKISLIDEAFDIWMRNYPISYHPLDMRRFYVLVKIILRFERKEHSSDWLRKSIIAHSNSKGFDEDNIEYFCDLLEKLRTFEKTRI